MIGERLKDLRKSAKMSQKELAGIIGVANSMIFYYESDKKQPSVDVLEKIADHFLVSTDYLLGRTERIKIDNSIITKNTGAQLTADEIKLVKDLYERLNKL